MPYLKDMHYEYKADRELSASYQGNVLWNYRFTTQREKPYIHPLRTLHGIELTAFEPWDHQWHRGLWYSWQYVNDIDYFEERSGVPGGAGAGKLVFTAPEVVTINPKRAKVVTHYDHVEPGGLRVMQSVRTLRFHPPTPDGRYTIDLDLSWTAKTDLVIRRAPDPHPGHSGLALRAARTLGNVRRLNSEGQRDDATHAAPARWVDITGTADGGWDRVGGIALMDHPDNFRAPAVWNTLGNEGHAFLNPSVVTHKPFHLNTGDGLILRYRALIHDGEIAKNELDDAFDLYVEESTPHPVHGHA